MKACLGNRLRVSAWLGSFAALLIGIGGTVLGQTALAQPNHVPVSRAVPTSPSERLLLDATRAPSTTPGGPVSLPVKTAQGQRPSSSSERERGGPFRSAATDQAEVAERQAQGPRLGGPHGPPSLSEKLRRVAERRP